MSAAPPQAGTARRISAGAVAAAIAIAFVAWRVVAVQPDTTVMVQGLLTGLLVGAVYGLIAMGLTLIFGVLEIVNFAHGAMLTFGMYVAFVIVDATGVNPYVTVLAVVPALFLLGAVLQAVIINPTMGQPLENQLLLTFGVAILIENGLLLWFGATPRRVGVDAGEPLRLLGAIVTVPRLIAFAGALAVAAALYGVLRRTRIGTAVRAVGQNPRGASLVGIDPRRIYVLTFALGASTVGAAAVLVLPFLQLEPVTGASFTIIAFVVVVLGGLGDVIGALVGGLIIGVVQQMGGVLLPDQDNLLPVFVVFVATLFLRPEGLFGRRET